MPDILKRLFGSGLGRSSYENKLIAWGEETLPEPQAPLEAKTHIESWKELEAEELGEKDAELNSRRLYRGRRRRRHQRLQELREPADARKVVAGTLKLVYDEVAEQYKAAAKALNLLCHRRTSTRAYVNAKRILATADAVGLSFAFAGVFGISPLMGFVLGMAATVGLISAGTLGADLRAHLTRKGDEAAMKSFLSTIEDKSLQVSLRLAFAESIDDKTGAILLKIVAGVFALTCASVGILRLAAGEGVLASGVLVILAITSIVTTAVLSWRNHNRFADLRTAARVAFEEASRDYLKASDDRVIAKFEKVKAAVTDDIRLEAAERKAYRHLHKVVAYAIRAANPEIFGRGRRAATGYPGADGAGEAAERVASAPDYQADPASGASNGAN